MTRPRLPYAESCERLQPDYLDAGGIPPLPSRRPRYDDETLGVSFFRTLVEQDDLSNLTIPRTFFGRSELIGVSFENTDLSESVLCWNDFVEVNFSFAVLAKADLRAAEFSHCAFRHSDLRGADLRQSSFEDCDFDEALMDGAVLTRVQGEALSLSSAQREVIAWTTDDGPEPDGG
jgi:uncharacterized protein YjbI with pentapeptide repeats